MMTADQAAELFTAIGTAANGDETVLANLDVLRKDMDTTRGDMEALQTAAKAPDGFATWDDAYNRTKAERDAIRAQYVERFFSAPASEPAEPPKPTETKMSFDDLFKMK